MPMPVPMGGLGLVRYRLGWSGIAWVGSVPLGSVQYRLGWFSTSPGLEISWSEVCDMGGWGGGGERGKGRVKKDGVVCA